MGYTGMFMLHVPISSFIFSLYVSMCLWQKWENSGGEVLSYKGPPNLSPNKSPLKEHIRQQPHKASGFFKGPGRGQRGSHTGPSPSAGTATGG